MYGHMKDKEVRHFDKELHDLCISPKVQAKSGSYNGLNM